MTRQRSFWEKIAEPELYRMLLEMGDSRELIDRYQRNRILQTLLLFLVSMAIGYFYSKYFYVIGAIATFTFYRGRFTKVQRFYISWSFDRQFEFSKFRRLLIPYLKQNKGQVSLYGVFNKLLNRIPEENQAARNSLYQLMMEISRDPSNIQPYLNYAKRASDTDSAYNFMSALYDFQQTTHDMTAIEELGELANEDLLRQIDEIINFKLRKFSMYPTKLAMTPIVLIFGYVAAVIYDSVMSMSFF